MNELKNRGVQDILIAVVPSHGLQANHCQVIDGLKGFPEAITAAFPEATVQPGLRPFRAELVHRTNSTAPFTLHRPLGAPFPELLCLEGPQVRGHRPAQNLWSCHSRSGRHRTGRIRGKRGRQICLNPLPPSHRVPRSDCRATGQCMFTCTRGAPAWRRAWQEMIPFFAFDPAIQRSSDPKDYLHDERPVSAACFACACQAMIKSLNRVIRKSIRTRGSFPTEEAATKLIYLAIRIFEKGGRNVREWCVARNQFAIMFEERFNACQSQSKKGPDRGVKRGHCV